MPLSDEPIGLLSLAKSGPSSHFRRDFLGLMRDHFGIHQTGKGEHQHTFAWKNQIFVASRQRLQRHSRAAYLEALRYILKDRQQELRFFKSLADAKDHDAFTDIKRQYYPDGIDIIVRGGGRIPSKVYPNAADQFERMWQEILGSCGGKWDSCIACPADCGICEILRLNAHDGRTVISC